MTLKTGTPQNIKGARVLAMLGDSVTTDHISPAGNIAATSPAAKYLESLGVHEEGLQLLRRAARQPRGHGARHVREHPLEEPARCPAPKAASPCTSRAAQQMSIYDASMKYQAEKTPLVILAGKEYGAGSSRDWAAKGTALLGVRAVIAESYERIHRSNLIGMGVVPLQFCDGDTAASLGLTGKETFDIEGLGLAAREGSRQSRRPTPTARRRRSRPSCASTRRRSRTTSSTAASCSTCCASSRPASKPRDVRHEARAALLAPPRREGSPAEPERGSRRLRRRRRRAVGRARGAPLAVDQRPSPCSSSRSRWGVELLLVARAAPLWVVAETPAGERTVVGYSTVAHADRRHRLAAREARRLLEQRRHAARPLARQHAELRVRRADAVPRPRARAAQLPQPLAVAVDRGRRPRASPSPR